jgi:hypothetical protein
MSKIMTVAIMFALVPLGALAQTNGMPKGNAPKPTPALGGPAGAKTNPAVGGPSKGVAPQGRNTSAPAPNSTIGGSSVSMPNAVNSASPKRAVSGGAPASQPSPSTPNAVKSSNGKTP